MTRRFPYASLLVAFTLSSTLACKEEKAYYDSATLDVATAIPLVLQPVEVNLNAKVFYQTAVIEPDKIEWTVRNTLDELITSGYTSEGRKLILTPSHPGTYKVSVKAFYRDDISIVRDGSFSVGITKPYIDANLIANWQGTVSRTQDASQAGQNGIWDVAFSIGANLSYNVTGNNPTGPLDEGLEGNFTGKTITINGIDPFGKGYGTIARMQNGTVVQKPINDIDFVSAGKICTFSYVKNADTTLYIGLSRP
jgi:hypothetical protein